MTTRISTTESVSTRLSMRDRARAALTADLGTGTISADTLKYLLFRYEHPATEALWNAGRDHPDRDAFWAALREWEAENPASAGNMRHVLEALTAEGLLTKDVKVQGKYKWATYKLAAVPA